MARNGVDPLDLGINYSTQSQLRHGKTQDGPTATLRVLKLRSGVKLCDQNKHVF